MCLECVVVDYIINRKGTPPNFFHILVAISSPSKFYKTYGNISYFFLTLVGRNSHTTHKPPSNNESSAELTSLSSSSLPNSSVKHQAVPPGFLSPQTNPINSGTDSKVSLNSSSISDFEDIENSKKDEDNGNKTALTWRKVGNAMDRVARFCIVFSYFVFLFNYLAIIM